MLDRRCFLFPTLFHPLVAERTQRSVLMSMSVSVCLSLYTHVLGTTNLTSPDFLCTLSVALARSDFALAALRYIVYFRFYGRRHACT